MPIPNKPQVQSLLRPREQVITEVVLTAWDRWWNNPERIELNKRSRATLIHNYMMIRATPAFSDDPRIHPIAGQETTYFVVDQQLVFRLKKGDGKGLSRNVETQTALAFVDPQGTLPGLPDVGRVDIAYVLNPFETLVERILVVARDGDTIPWFYPIYPKAAALATPILAIQPPPPKPADNVVRLPAADPKKKETSKTEE